MRYTTYYGMKRNCFLDCKVADTFITEDYRECMSRLGYLKQVKGLGVIYGEGGYGKTFNLRCFASTLNRNQYKIVYLQHTTTSVFEFYKMLALGLDIPIVCSKADLFIAIQAKIKDLSVNYQITTCIIIDEANRLGCEIFNDLELLLNFDMDASRFCILIISGKPELIERIPQSLADRTMTKYEVKGIDQAEVEPYINAMLNASGCSKKVFDDSGINALARCCNGNIRRLNMLIDKCLFFNSQLEDKKNYIDNELVMRVYQEIILKNV